MFKLNFSFALLLMVGFASINAKKHEVEIYTKQGCSNCNYTKQRFNDSQIKYNEFALEDDANATPMLKKLRQHEYTDKILLPVIFIDNKLYHPKKNDTIGYESISEVVDYIISIKGQLDSDTARTSFDKESVNSTDCESSYTRYYLICSRVGSAEKAGRQVETFKTVYPASDFTFHKNKYLVYIDFFYVRDDAVMLFDSLKEDFDMLYILKITN
ncbi:glutaredoxin [Bacteroidales bacterium]|nr:glutaredoxin [Bacteroidales bacterium]